MRVTEVVVKTLVTSIISKSWSHDFIGYYGSGSKKLGYFRNLKTRGIEFSSTVTEVAGKTHVTSVNLESPPLNFSASYGSSQ